MSPAGPSEMGFGDEAEDDRERGPAPLHDLTAFQRDLLKAVRDVSESEPIGKDVCADLEIERDESIEPGRFYPNVIHLEEKGLLERYNANGNGKVVALTDHGEEQVAARAEWWQDKRSGGRR